MKDGGTLDIVSDNRFGLVGKSLSHSYSKYIHSFIGDYNYNLYEVAPHEVSNFFHTQDFKALNVTIPYKKVAYDICTSLSGSALRSHSVNLVVKENDGTLKGYNTDYDALKSLIDKYSIPVSGKRILILGTGGAACTARAVCAEYQTKSITLVSRHGQNNYNNIDLHYDSDLLINCTPVGMYPNNGASPISLDGFNNLAGVIEFIYNPIRTLLIQQAQERKIKAYSGLYNLVAQAVYSSGKFLETVVDTRQIELIVQKTLQTKRNVALIGMPGCGKTTLGQALAEKLGKPFIDIDNEIEKAEQMSIPEIFRNNGEKYFREVEKNVTLGILKENGNVVATGGGAILLQENRQAILENSVVIYIRRETDALFKSNAQVDTSPESIERIADIRIPIYESLADITIRAGESIENNVNLILEALKNEIAGN